MRRVILESPFAGRGDTPEARAADEALNIKYARACVRDALERGDAPIASHLLYTQEGILRDDVLAERAWGIEAGLAWGAVAEATVLYVDRGISRGMQYGIDNADKCQRPVEYRKLPIEVMEKLGIPIQVGA